MIAVAHPFYTNSPARIPEEWFTADGILTATAFLSNANLLGICLGVFLPTLFVTVDGDRLFGFTGIMMMEVICCWVGFMLTLLFFYDRPPVSPSLLQTLRKTTNIYKIRGLKNDLADSFKNMHFLMLCLGYGIMMGILNALVALINQYTAAFGYDTDDAGIFGVVFISTGCLSQKFFVLNRLRR